MAGRTSSGAALVLVAALLAGCAAPPPVRTVEGEGGDGAPSVASVPPGPRRTVIPADAPTPADLNDQSPARVRALLGPPGLTRREPPAEVWQYAGRECVLDIFFYPTADAGPLRAAHLDSRDMGGRALTPGECLALLAADSVEAAGTRTKRD